VQSGAPSPAGSSTERAALNQAAFAYAAASSDVMYVAP
jgi:hypothetical protein